MHVMINEYSFIGQAKSVAGAPTLMKTILNIIKELKPIQKSDPIYTHSTFWECRLSANSTVYDWATTRFPKNADPDDRDIRSRFVRTVKNGPFIDKVLTKALEYHKCYFKKQDVSSSSIAGAVHFKGILVSLQDAPEFESEHLKVKFSTDGEYYEDVEVYNLTKEGQLWLVRRRYVPTLKHAPGGRGTRMDLNDETAQTVLDDGIAYGGQVYGYHHGKLYIFQYDNAGGYHGYPVDRVPIPVIRKMQETGIFPMESPKIKNLIGHDPFRPK